MMAEPAGFNDALRLLTEKYRKQLPDRLVEIDGLLSLVLQADTFDAERMATLHRSVHSLTGTGATFGLSELSNASRSLEILLKECVNTASPFNAETKNKITLLWDAVKAAALRTDDEPS
jgi:chemotaxis protein histidine kinase CheA